MLRTTRKGIQQGVVQVPRGGGVSEALMAYMQESEQITSVIAACTAREGDRIGRSCGYIVQLLPEAERGLLMVMTERLAAFPAPRDAPDLGHPHGRGPPRELLFGMPFTVVSESQLRFSCNCSQERFLSSLATLPESELADMIRQNEPLEIRCHGCGKEYVITPAELLTLVAKTWAAFSAPASAAKHESALTNGYSMIHRWITSSPVDIAVVQRLSSALFCASCAISRTVPTR